MSIYIGQNKLKSRDADVGGEYVKIDENDYYKISNYDQMTPFFMTIVSASDHWMFISSTGGLTAGRINSEAALFPYYPEDKIRDNYENTGSKSIFIVKKEDKEFLWEPFSPRYVGVYEISRNLYKNIPGNQLIFEEVNYTLGITFSYRWAFSDLFGIVKTSRITNNSDSPIKIKILDGIQNILPSGAGTRLQTRASNLLEAYKRNELDTESLLGVFAMTSTLTDLPEAREALKATTAWQSGLKNEKYLLSSCQVDSFRKGKEISQETDMRGFTGAFFVNAEVAIQASEKLEWYIVAEVNQDHTKIKSLTTALKSDRDTLASSVAWDISLGTDNLNMIVSSADGIQLTGDRLSSAHHYANVMFNSMRGGIFADGYQIEKTDLLDYLSVINKKAAMEVQHLFNDLPDYFSVYDLNELYKLAGLNDNMTFRRICSEYLPLCFSRRHGDPSRPWNSFSINLKKEDGTKKLDYEGNWRDIFQNWEALAYAFPEFTEGMICRFLNCSTADGYNPYRITRNGIDWEKPEPGCPWVNIGYWGDHQVIYLQKLIETSLKFHPEKIPAMLEDEVFAYANVPYRIKDYSSILRDSRATIDFDWDADKAVDKLVEKIGADGRLVMDKKQQVLHVNLTEKMLVLLLAKMSNFIPEGGIWMNTQRPEWNDSNNALVGNGISMVTLYYLRRYVNSYWNILSKTSAETFAVSTEIEQLFAKIAKILEDYLFVIKDSFSDRQRKSMMDELGWAGSNYRAQLYKNGFSGSKIQLEKMSIQSFLGNILKYIDHSIRANRRDSGLYQAYNLIKIDGDSASISNMYEMLEGQVAILSSGFLSPAEAVETLDALRNSGMYREDQHSYTLFTPWKLKGFLTKNCIPKGIYYQSPLIRKLVDDGDISLISRDCEGELHFNGEIKNVKCVKKILNQLARNYIYNDLVTEETDFILNLFEATFEHNAFTGRAGAMYGFEGLESIYWHMVSKLLLATQEVCIAAEFQGNFDTGSGIEGNDHNSESVSKLKNHYYEIRNGIGFNKTPKIYGAFPTDPYSHTAAGKGAKQPGMTGQVKEEIITRPIELGVMVEDGAIYFLPQLIRDSELLDAPDSFDFFDVNRGKRTIKLQKQSLAMTFCQVPIIFKKNGIQGLTVFFSDGVSKHTVEMKLSKEISREIFERTGRIELVEVCY